MNINKTTPYFLVILALLVAGCFSISPAARAADPEAESSQKIRELLSEVKTEAIALERDAHNLDKWARGKQMNPQSHANQLTVMREHINKAGELLAQMNEARHAASPWQQQALDRIHPLLKELADNTEETINHFNERQSNIHFGPYSDYTKAGADLADELAALVSDYVEFGEHEADYHRLKDKLAPATS